MTDQPLSRGDAPFAALALPAAKRLFDIVAAAAGLAALAPVLITCAMAIKLTSRGPVFFVQPRRGKDGRVFHIYKLRTLRQDQCDLPEYSTSAVTDSDPRVLPVGWAMRLRGLDEIPQLWNVLIGDMSIFGPRPHMLSHDDFFQIEIPFYSRRQRVRPGITGWAQVNGCRGSVHSLADVYRRLQYDLHYIDHYRFRMDIVIALRTLGIVLFGAERWRVPARTIDRDRGSPSPPSGVLQTLR